MRRFAAAALVLMAVVGVTACEGRQAGEEEHAAVTAAVRDYLKALADAYSGYDLSPLEGHASPNEIEAVRVLIRGLVSSGDRLEATLLSLEILELEIFREVNASVNALEVWDVRRLDAGSGEEIGHNPSSVQRSFIQLRKIDGEWVVVGRRVMERDPGDDPEAAAEPE